MGLGRLGPARRRGHHRAPARVFRPGDRRQLLRRGGEPGPASHRLPHRGGRARRHRGDDQTPGGTGAHDHLRHRSRTISSTKSTTRAAYLNPDATADFTSVHPRRPGGTTGSACQRRHGRAASRPPTRDSCARRGLRREAKFAYSWPDAEAKARLPPCTSSGSAPRRRAPPSRVARGVLRWRLPSWPRRSRPTGPTWRRQAGAPRSARPAGLAHRRSRERGPVSGAGAGVLGLSGPPQVSGFWQSVWRQAPR